MRARDGAHGEAGEAACVPATALERERIYLGRRLERGRARAGAVHDVAWDGVTPIHVMPRRRDAPLHMA